MGNNLAQNNPEDSSCEPSEINSNNAKENIIKDLNSALRRNPAGYKIHRGMPERCKE